MNTNLSILFLVCLSLVTPFLSTILAQKLPEWHRILDRKPFNCRPCLCFHLTWISASTLALFFQTWQLAVGGVSMSFILFGILKLRDNKKITE